MVRNGVAAGSPLAAENSVLTIPMLTAATHSGASVRSSVRGGIPPRVRPAASATAASTRGGARAVVNARPMSQTSATASFRSGLVRPRALSSWASVRSSRCIIAAPPARPR